MSPPIVTDGPMMAPDWGIDQAHASFGASIGATASESWADSPLSQLMTGGEIERAKGADGTEPTSFDPLGNAVAPSVNGVDLTEQVKPAIPRMDIIEANDRVKKAGLEKHLTLPDQPDMPPAQLAIMMRNAQARAEHEATIERGPQGFIPSALQVGTSFLVGAADPINVASAFIPVMGELRYGKVLAAAGDSLTARLATRAAVGGAQGAVGQAALEPLDWWAHTQEGRDFGMSDVLHNIMFGAALGGALHAGGGFISDAYRNAKGRPLYPFGPNEPLASHRDVESATGATPSSSPARAAAEVPNESDVSGPLTHIDEILSESSAPPSHAVQVINDLPPRAHEDAMRVAIADLINGDAVRAGDVLEAAAQTDPRIAESLDIPKEALHLVRDDHLPGNGDTVSYSINGADGSNVGFAEFVIDGDTARVLDVASFAFNGDRERYGEVRNSIGARQLRELLDQFRDLHSEVKKLTADRVSGARKGGAYDAGLKANEIEVRLAPRRGGATKPDRAQIPDGAHEMPLDVVTRDGDLNQSPFILSDGTIVGTDGDHSSVYSPHEQREAGALRASVGPTADGGFHVYVDAREGQAISKEQLGVIAHLLDQPNSKFGFTVRPGSEGPGHVEPIVKGHEVDAFVHAMGGREAVVGGAAERRASAVNVSAGQSASNVVAANLDKAAAWRGIAHVTPEFDSPEAIAASNAAAKVERPRTSLDERVTAAQKAEAFAKSMYDMFAHRLPEEERVRLEEHIAEMERAQADRDTVSQRGAACLFEGRGA